MSEFLDAKRRPHITLRKFDKEWFRSFFLWLKNDYVPQKFVRKESKPLSESSLKNVQQRIRLYCGSPYGLSFESSPGEGTSVTVLLPCVSALSESGLLSNSSIREGGKAE